MDIKQDSFEWQGTTWVAEPNGPRDCATIYVLLRDKYRLNYEEARDFAGIGGGFEITRWPEQTDPSKPINAICTSYVVITDNSGSVPMARVYRAEVTGTIGEDGFAHYPWREEN